MALDELEISRLLEERGGVSRLGRAMFTDPEIYELELRHIFEGNWVYLAHESQLPDPYDFVTGHIGRQPILLSRGPSGELRGFLNSCTHRGAQLKSAPCGNTKRLTCPFHAWTFATDGTLVSCGETERAGYSAEFDKQDLNLKKIARVESYRGFIFGSLSADVPSLEVHLGEARKFLDLIVDQDPNGEIEIVPGPQVYTFDGNWKLQTENGVDGYHIGSIHGNYVATTQNRHRLSGANARIKPMDVSRFSDFPGGFYAFEHGHVVLWNESPNPQIRPAFDQRARYVAEFGEERAWWMTQCWRNLCLYPNVFVMDQMSTQIRVLRPLTIDRTEVRTICFAPKSDTAEQRTRRIRQYEDFFNASGMATPDDLAAFNASQVGLKAGAVGWSDISRGATNLVPGADERAARLGLAPQFTGTNLEDEAIYLNQHRRWRDLLVAGLRRDRTQAEAAQ